MLKKKDKYLIKILLIEKIEPVLALTLLLCILILELPISIMIIL